MTKLTKKQKEHLVDLTENKRLYVGFISPDIMRSFDVLVKKGYAVEINRTSYGKNYEIIKG